MKRRNIMFRNLCRIIVLCSCVFALAFFGANGYSAETRDDADPDDRGSAAMRALLDCTCECGLTLAYCEKEDADCSVRPALLSRLEGLLDEGKTGMDLIRAFMGPIHPIKEQLMEARVQNRHAILFFYQEGCGDCDAAKAALNEGAETWGDEVTILDLDVNDKDNEKIQHEFRVFSTPTMLVVAPNGVVVNELKKNITVDNIQKAFVTPGMAQILRGLQDKRIIFLTVHAEDWENAASVTKTVRGVGDILRNSVRVVHVDPTSGQDGALLKALKVNGNQNQSLTFVVSQSGGIGNSFEGPVSRKDLFLAFQRVLASRSGCGGSGSGLGGNTCK
jgi:thiol-disulfide isomerase/thioredoxin